MISFIALLLAAVTPFGLRNGDFRETANGGAVGWNPVSHYRVAPDGGRRGLPALELTCSGQGDSAGAMQKLKFDRPRKGPFAVSAWVMCEGVGGGGDCSLWLDVFQADGSPLWGRQGIPERSAKGWQHVTAEVHPDKPVSEVQIYLLLRNIKGRARFCDVTIRQLPLEVRNLRVFPSGKTVDVRADISENVSWRLRAVQRGKEIRSFSGEGSRVSDRFEVSDKEPLTVIVTADRDGVEASAKATVPPQDRAKPLYWWVADSFTRVFQDDLPPERSAERAELNAARNDRESFQVCLRPGEKALTNVRVDISDLVSSGQASQPGSRIPHTAIESYRVGYVWVKQPAGHPYSPRSSSAWWPDPLLPSGVFSVKPGEVQPLWFTVRVPKDAVPGDYTGKVTITADDVPPVTVPVSITVHHATVPDQGYMKTAFALMDCYLQKVYGKITPGLRRSYTDYLLAHHLNPDDISRSTLPDLDELEYANKHGLNTFNILNVVEEPKRGQLWTCWSPLEAYTPGFRERFLKKLDAFVPELEKRGLIDKAYVYGFDERGPEYIAIIRDLFGAIKQRYPKIHTLSTCWPPAGTDPLSLNIDWYVPLSSSYDPQLAKKVRDRGGEMWWYVCLGPKYPYANWLLENPLIEARLIWWQAFQNDVEGFLYWGLNIWQREHNDKPIADSSSSRIDWSVTTGGNCPSLNGDGVLLYPGEHGPIGSIRLECIRDGLEDIELLRSYRQRYGVNAAKEILKPVVTDRIRYSRNPADLLAARRRVLKGLDVPGPVLSPQ